MSAAGGKDFRAVRTRPGRVRAAAGASEVARVLITKVALAKRVRELAAEIDRDFVGRDLTLVAVLNGTVMFLADLARGLRLPLRLDFMAVSSYGDGTVPGEIVFSKDLRLDVRGRDVLVVDDIADSGRTLHRVITRVRELRPRRIKTCVLLDKPSRRKRAVRLDYVGFSIPDVFVVGYGLDYAERHRNLPYIGALNLPPKSGPARQVKAGVE